MSPILKSRFFASGLASTLLLVVSTGCAGSRSRVNPWALETTPYPAPPESIGSTGSGCLSGAVPLLGSLGQIELMRPERRRHYAHPILRKYLEDLAGHYRKKGLGALFVGDVAQVRGGPFLTGHKSHQTGLDADLWYDVPRPSNGLNFTDAERSQVSPRKLGQMPAVNPALWSPSIRSRIQIAAKDPRVERIFVHPSIKKAFCEIPAYQSRKNKSWMARLRPWWGHDYHFHVRLKCPGSDTRCHETTDPVPSENGCDESLAWWFSEEATLVGKAPEHQPGADPDRVPAACFPLLTPPAQ